MRCAVAIVLVLVSILCGLSRARADEDDRPSDRAAIEAMMARIQRAIATTDSAVLTALFDADEALAAVEEQGLLAKIDAGNRLGFKLGFSLGVKLAIGQGDFLEPFESFRLRRLVWRGDDRAEAYVRLKDADGLVQKIQWYLVKRGDAWRFYDYMDLDLGLRFSLLVGVAVRGTLEEESPPEWVRHAEEFEGAVDAILAGDLGNAVRILEALDGLGWPAGMEATRLVLLGACCVGLEDPESALRHSGRALAIAPAMPLAHVTRAGALNQIGRHEEALKHAKLYVKLLDADAGVLLEVGTALQGLGRDEEAIATWKEGLSDDPTDLDLLGKLLLALPAAQKNDLRPYLFQQEDLVVATSVLAEVALAARDADALGMVVDTLRSRHPEHADGDYYEGHQHRLTGAFAKAGAAFGRGWPKIEDPEERAIFLDWYFDSMVRAGRAVEAFGTAPDPEAALERLAGDLIRTGQDEQLAALADAAAKAEPRPLGLPRLQGLVAYRRGEFAEARSHLEPLRATLSAEAPEALRSPEGEAWGRWGLLWAVEDSLLRTYVKLDRFADARSMAEEIAQRDDDVQYLVAIHVLKGEVDAAAGLAMRARAAGQDLSHLLEDEDVKELLAKPDYARVRAALSAE